MVVNAPVFRMTWCGVPVLTSVAPQHRMSNMKNVYLSNTTTIGDEHPLTIREADVICVLEQGRLVERGTHDELCEKRGPSAHRSSRELAA